jgi:hypothetical protein
VLALYIVDLVYTEHPVSSKVALCSVLLKFDSKTRVRLEF